MFNTTKTTFEGFMDGLLNDFEGLMDSVFTTAKPTVTNVGYNIQSNERESIISILVPGIKKEEIKIEINGKLLTIEYPDRPYYSSYGNKISNPNIQRAFKIGDHVDKDAIQSKLEDGVLKISLNKMVDKKETKKVITID